MSAPAAQVRRGREGAGTAEGVAQARAERLRELLVARGLLSRDRLTEMERVASENGERLSELVLRSGDVGPETLLAVLEELHGVPAVDVSRESGDASTLELLSKKKAFELEVLPLWSVAGQLTVAMADPSDLAKLDQLSFITGQEVLPCVALAPDVRRRLREAYGPEEDASLEVEVPDQADDEADSDEAARQLDERADAQPVVKLVDRILLGAIEAGASDVHLEPLAGRVQVRYRVDGLLRVEPCNIPARLGAALVSRIKVLTDLDISVQRVPQDGKLRVRRSGRAIDVRVSTFPTIRGEKAVLRLLDRSRGPFCLDELSMDAEILEGWKRLASRHEGLLLVTGPTGSGKTSTLYATLRRLAQPERNVVTLEDPVEYEISGIAQARVNERVGMTFARGLRSILRQDPDVILVGEIRDLETGEIAVQSAMTGHLVLSTLHTNDAPSAVTRLLDLGVPSYLVPPTLLGVMAQRLVRRPCRRCIGPATPSEDEVALLGHWLDDPELPFEDGHGCPDCRGMGYLGRVAVHELLEMSAPLRRALVEGERELGPLAASWGYEPMWLDGVKKVKEGSTTLRELVRVVDPLRDEESD